MKNRIRQCRTFRVFEEGQRLEENMLLDLVDCGRLGGSARNCQPWQYLPVTSEDICGKIFPTLGWAGYLTDWRGPAPGQRPAAYILCLLNSRWLKGPETEAWCDLGIASQNILLAAMEQGIGGCRIGAFSPGLSQIFSLPDHLRLKLVIALGKPAETVILEEGANEDDIRYWRDDAAVHHVPKRNLDDIIVTAELAG